ncbi:MAG: hypothetical protein OXJ56_20015 [Rhodospirillaceae bacterium]|nr:hypothetical protein [Rhodospirillaceae bacterium]
MATRTTILLDDDVRTAARELASRYGCSVSEAIRRAVLRHRDAVLVISQGRRAARIQILEELFDLFQGHDAEEEIRRLKEQDEGF